ncbi:putative phenylalanine--tRNA ligase [Helianthus anomalus]
MASYSVKKGLNYAPKRRKPATDLRKENLQSGEWKDLQFKECNFLAKGIPTEGGYLHPLLKVERVYQIHESGGHGSRGYGYDWKREEANKNLLRTHTTAVSSRMLYALAKKPFEAKRYYSIDRVFISRLLTGPT